MPELPEVEITKNKLISKKIVGLKVRDVFLDYKPSFKSPLRFLKAGKDLAGRTVEKVERKGKVVFLQFSGEPRRSLVLHLRMSGTLLLKDGEMDDRHIHFKVYFQGGPASKNGQGKSFSPRHSRGGKILLFHDPRKFGLIWYGTDKELEKYPYLANLGKDMLKVDSDTFIRVLSDRRGQIKPFLTRQDVFAGIGNIIADEALWEAKIHPKKPAEKLNEKEIMDLYKSITGVIRRIIKAGGTSMRDWEHPDEKKKSTKIGLKFTTRKNAPDAKKRFQKPNREEEQVISAQGARNNTPFQELRNR